MVDDERFVYNSESSTNLCLATHKTYREELTVLIALGSHASANGSVWWSSLALQGGYGWIPVDGGVRWLQGGYGWIPVDGGVRWRFRVDMAGYQWLVNPLHLSHTFPLLCLLW